MSRLDLSQIARAAEMLNGLCGDDEQCFSDMLVGETDIDRIVLRIHEQVARDEEILVGIGERKASIAEREGRIKARKDAGRTLIGKILRVGLLAKLELPEVTYSVRDGKPGLKVVDPAAVPEEFQRWKAEPDKPKINETYADKSNLPNWLVREVARDVVTARTK